MGTEGMKASLVSREVVADSIELVVRGHLLDGVVCLVGCDKTIPGAALALGRLDVPGLVLYNGTIYPGVYKGRRDATVVTVFEAIGRYRAGTMTLDELYEVENAACPGPGACGGQYTANTMSMVMELIGLSPAGLKRDPWPRTRPRTRRPIAPVRSSWTSSAATCGRRRSSTGGRSRTASPRWPLRRLDERRPPPPRDRPRVRHPARHRRVRRDRRRTPIVADMVPGGRFLATDLYEAGGIGLVTRELLRGGHLHGEAPTVDGRTIAETAAAVVESARPAGRGAGRDTAQADRRAGHPPRLARPRTAASSSWPATSGASTGGPARSTRRTTARRRQCRLDRGGRRRRHPLRGPGRGPGMQEMLSVTAALVGRGSRLGRPPHRRPLQRRDPRAHDRPRRPGGGLGGPIAFVEDGDPIVVDVDRKALDLDIPADELARRRAGWTRPEPRYRGGVMAKYAALVGSASQGAVTTGPRMTAQLGGR
jgi:dihydroxy-acid dehydratase